MTPDRWRQVEDLCHAALARAGEERAAFLADSCAGDDALQREVESLLAQEPHDRAFMSTPAAAATESAVMDHAEGTLIGRRLGVYAIRSLLGVGGMGEVYRAHDDTLGREVAIKVLPAAFIGDPERRARFEREARILATLNHPHIGAIYGVEEHDGVRALVLELVEGETLAERILVAGRLPIAEVLVIARQIADALDAAHEKGIVHRDLKPANIKITSNGAVKVLDFGLAKSARTDGSRPDLSDSRDGAILGTAAYMSPEQARGQSVDKRGDIWAFGCVLYQMLTGHLTFPGETVSDTIAKILEREPDWSALPAATPAPVRRLLIRCLAKDPKQRLRDIGDVRLEIDAIDEVPAGATALPAPTKTRTKWLPWIAITALAAAVGLWEVRRPVTTQEGPLAKAQFSRFTDWEGTEGAAEISPDGRFVAFVADRDGEFDLWLSQVGTGEFRNLTANIAPVGGPHSLLRTFGFSGDGAEIWFSLAGDPIQERKMLLPLIGGTPRAFLEQGDASPSWSSDGTRLVYFQGRRVGGPNTAGGDPLFVADRTGGDARQILAPEKGMHNHNPVWSPDDQWLYYVHGFVRGLNWTDEVDVWRVRPSGGSPERLTHQDTAVTFLAPLDTRTLLYVARAADGSGPWLWTLDAETKVTRRVNSGLDKYTSVAASRNGRRVVATIADPTTSLWTVPILDREAENRDVRPYPVTTGRALAPRFGGTSLFFLSARGTGDGLWRFQDGQAFEVRKGADGPLFEPPAVSRDGSRVAVVLVREGRRQLALMSADGTGLRRLAESIDIQGAADWSPDGVWIVTGGNDDGQGPGLFKVPVDGGVPIRLVAGQAVNPVWSPDGNLIVYASALVPGQVAPLLGVRPDGAPLELPPVRVRTDAFRFLPNGAGLVYLPGNLSLDFSLLDFATKKTRQLTRLSNQGRLGTFDITPDGEQIVFERSRENSDIVLIDRPE